MVSLFGKRIRLSLSLRSMHDAGFGVDFAQPDGSVRHFSDQANALRYSLERLAETEKLRKKMRQAVVWTGWEDAARRNKRNG